MAEDRPSPLARLVASTPPEQVEADEPEACGLPTLRQDADGNWIPCPGPPHHDGPCR